MKRAFCLALGLLLLLCGCSGSPAPELKDLPAVADDLARVTREDIFLGTVTKGYVFPELVEMTFSRGGTIGSVEAPVGARVKKGAPVFLLETGGKEKDREQLAEQLEYTRRLDGFASREAELNLKLTAEMSGTSSSSYRLMTNELAAAARNREREIDELEDRLAELDKELDNAVVAAPCSGTVIALRADVGSAVQREDSAAVIAGETGCYLATEFFAENVVMNAMELYAEIGGKRYDLEYIPPEKKEFPISSRTFFEVKKGTAALTGEFAVLHLITDFREQVLTVPINCLLRDEKGSYVYVEAEGKPVRREVKTGMVTAARTEILSGLEEGETVYVVG